MTEVEFDRIADVYDDTRRALDPETLGGMMEMLNKYACRSILEIAVGTGRVSVPLMDRGFEVTGIDISRRMMERARAKGLPNLVLADGGGTAFKDGSFDVTLMAHVFHILEDPLTVMREAARVSRVGVFALLRKGGLGPWRGFWGSQEEAADPGGEGEEGHSEEATKFYEARRERFRRLAEKYNWNWESSRRERHWEREAEILQSHPPDELKVVSDVLVTETLEERIDRFRKGGYGFMTDMPEEMKEEIIGHMREDARTLPESARQPRHEVYQVAVWRSETLLRGPALKAASQSPI